MFLSISQAVHYTENNLQCILDEYNRNPINVREDIDIINIWLETQHHLPLKPSMRQIFSFLIMNKFSIERTKQKLDFNYTVKNLMPEIFENMLPTAEEMIKIREVITVVPFPKLANLNRIMYIGCDFPNPKHLNMSAMNTYFIQTMEVRTIYDCCLGDDYIINFGHVELSILSKVGLMDMKKFTLLLQKVYSSRLTSIHFINVPSYALNFIELVSKFLVKKLRDRIMIHKNVEELRDYFPEECLPKELGFNGFSLQEVKENWTALLMENLLHLEIVQNAKVDENLRPVKLINDDLLGISWKF